MIKKLYFSLLACFMLFNSCSDFDEQDFTVLLPNAGPDQVIFTAESGTTIQLDGSASGDVNNIGFQYEWEIISGPEGFPGSISNTNIVNPTFEVSNEASGRYELSLKIFRGEQIARDFVNIDINPAIAQILLVNAIDAASTATLKIPSIGISGDPVASKNTDNTYYDIDTNIATEADGSVLLEVDYNGTTLTTNQTLEALKSYTLYLVGTEDNPEILFVEKTRNQNSIGVGLVALDAINLAPETDNVVLFIDATTAGFGILPVDAVFGVLGVPEQFGVINYKENVEIFFPSNSLIPLPIWATVNGERISNNANITLAPNSDGSFGTFMLFPDANAENGHTFIFVNNTNLLPQ